jgi:HEAT repeat protein
MKRLMAMISIGRDASNFFPDVVKNVVSDSLEVKKLVYAFLTHYAEQKSNEALLTINTFQKDLSDTNQLIRSSALRVMTSIRVPIIAQLQVMAVKQCVRDSSPYVRKAAAHAAAKVYALDPEQLAPLVEMIQVLLQDSSTVVIGSAVAAFNEARLLTPCMSTASLSLTMFGQVVVSHGPPYASDRGNSCRAARCAPIGWIFCIPTSARCFGCAQTRMSGARSC